MAPLEPSQSTEPFPPAPATPYTPGTPSTPRPPADSEMETVSLQKTTSTGPSPRRRSGSKSLAHSFLNSNPPYGMWLATGEIASKVPTLGEIRKGSFSTAGWTEEGQMEQRGHDPHHISRRQESRIAARQRRSSASLEPTDDLPDGQRQPSPETTRGVPSTIPEARVLDDKFDGAKSGNQDPRANDPPATDAELLGSSSTSENVAGDKKPPVGPDETGTYPNGYRFPPKHTWTQSTAIGLKAFWLFFITPFGFLVTVYGLNVVAWGAMIFFVLLNAAPAMCHPSCNDDYSARKIWIEIDSQILNALFCVTGLGLIPWRFRDLYYLMQWRIFGKYDYWRRLAGHNRGWFRLPGSETLEEHLAPPPVYTKKTLKGPDSAPEWTAAEIAELERNPAVPLPGTAMPLAPLTGVRAQPTKPILIDVIVWMYVLNTFLQIMLCGCMWGLNRFTRPSWTTGVLITLGCVTGIIAGIVVFIEGKKIKKSEGIPVEEWELSESDLESANGGLASSEKGVVVDEKVTRERSRGDEDLPGGGLALKRTKTKGRHWYERH